MDPRTQLGTETPKPASTVRRVLVPLDGSPLAELALGPARTVAERYDADITLLQAAWGEGSEASSYLDGQAARLLWDRTEVTTTSNHFAATSILQYASASDTLVCMTSHGRSGLGQSLLGSTAEEVVARLGRPILLVGPRFDDSRWKTGSELAGSGLLVAVEDNAPEDFVGAVRRWCSDFGLNPKVAQVRHADGRTGAPLDDLDRTLRETARAVSVHGPSARWHLIEADDPSAALLLEAERIGASTIAVATRAQVGLHRLTEGSTAAHLVHRSRHPVLVLRLPD